MVNICQQRPAVVFFAGSGEHLQKFIEVLPRRTCPDSDVNLVTGGSGTRIARCSGIIMRANRERCGLGSMSTLTYTSCAYPDAWAAAPESFSLASIGYFQEDCGDCFGSFFPDDSLDDAGAIVGHDAVVTAVEAIGPPPTTWKPMTGLITPGEVSQALNGLHGSFAVPGASGWISGIPVATPSTRPSRSLCSSVTARWSSSGCPRRADRRRSPLPASGGLETETSGSGQLNPYTKEDDHL